MPELDHLVSVQFSSDWAREVDKKILPLASEGEDLPNLDERVEQLQLTRTYYAVTFVLEDQYAVRLFDRMTLELLYETNGTLWKKKQYENVVLLGDYYRIFDRILDVKHRTERYIEEDVYFLHLSGHRVL